MHAQSHTDDRNLNTSLDIRFFYLRSRVSTCQWKGIHTVKLLHSFHLFFLSPRSPSVSLFTLYQMVLEPPEALNK